MQMTCCPTDIWKGTYSTADSYYCNQGTLFRYKISTKLSTFFAAECTEVLQIESFKREFYCDNILSQ